MTTQDYLTAFDGWLSQHIHAAMKSGKDLAFHDRRVNCSFKLDDDGAAWDYLLLAPGTLPPPGHAWTVYRLHGVHPPPQTGALSRIDAAPAARRRQRSLVARLTHAVFPNGRAAAC